MNRPLRVIDDCMEYTEFHCVRLKTIRANCVDCLYSVEHNRELYYYIETTVNCRESLLNTSSKNILSNFY